MLAGCERRSALFTGVAVKATCVIAIFKDYAASVLRCEMLLCFGGRHRPAFFRDRTGLQEMVSLCYVMYISTN